MAWTEAWTAASIVGSPASAVSRMPIPIPHGRLPRTAAPIIVALMQPKQRHWLTGMITSALPIAGLITMLLALAVLQLRWSMKVSEAERGRLQQNLQRSTSSFQLAFAQDLLGICQTLQAAQPREPAVLVGRLFDRYAVWHRMSRHAELIGSLYIWPQSNGRTDTLLKFNPQTRKLVPVAWPESLLSFSTQTRVRTNMLPRYSQAWVWDERVPALIHPIYALGSNKDPKRPRLFGYLFIVFSPQDFEQVYLPDLGRKYFPLSNGFVFQLIGHNGNHERRVVYQSDKHVPDVPFAHADAIIPLLDNLMPYRTAPRPPSSAMIPGVVPGPVQLSVSDISRWEISVRYRAGSVDAAVIGMRRRDLAVSAVVLVMLLVSLITILVATRRARRLAQIQMEFASEVSHELRTPLAVIRSAAENLADGVVTEGDRVRDYGVLIHKESQHLSGMVDHILDFAQMHSDVLRYRLENAAVTDIVEKVLAIERPLIQSAGVLMEVNIPDDLPMLLTNAPILQQCLQNLLSNALKYGSDGRRIFLDVSTVHENGEDRVLICVKDFGAGIAPEELSHIYEPFYRARDARDSQIRGTGLGLSLTRKMMEGLHGRITVESSPGKGSAFTLHVPVAHDKDVHALTSEPSRSG